MRCSYANYEQQVCKGENGNFYGLKKKEISYEYAYMHINDLNTSQNSILHNLSNWSNC